MMRGNMWIAVFGVVLLLGGGCSSAPEVATEEESKASMDETLSFDPMAKGSADAPKSPAP